MNELNFGLKQNIDNVVKPDKGEKTIEEVKEELAILAKKLSKNSSEKPDLLKIKEDFIKIQATIEKEIMAYIEREEGSDFNFSMDHEYESYFEIIDSLGLITEDNKKMTARLFMVTNDMSAVIAKDILRKRELYDSKEKHVNQDDHLAGYILEKFDFSKDEASDLIKSWLSVEDDEMARWYIRNNLLNLKGLENYETKSAKYLYSNFGIRGFGRYRMQELKKQYDERDDKGPYGVFCQAVMDWNGSFSQSNQSEEIRDKVEENSYTMRVIEVNGKIDLAKRLLSLRDKYDQKIKFMYIHAHGNTDVIGLGDRDGSDRKLVQEDLKGKGVQRIKELFEDDAELVVSSCLTGVEGGLAEEMSSVYNVKVIASDKPTEGEPKSIDIKKNATGNNLKFNIVFNTADDYEEGSHKTTKGTVIYEPKR